MGGECERYLIIQGAGQFSKRRTDHFIHRLLCLRVKLPCGCLNVAMATEGEPTDLIKVLHLLVMSFTWGVQVWVSFIAGFALVLQVTRHTFGLVQSKLFPVYFHCLLGSNFISLAVFAVYHPRELLDWHESVQMGLYFGALVLAGLNAQWFGPAVSESMVGMHEIEREHGLGKDVGIRYNREAYENCDSRTPNTRATMPPSTDTMGCPTSATSWGLYVPPSIWYRSIRANGLRDDVRARNVIKEWGGGGLNVESSGSDAEHRKRSKRNGGRERERYQVTTSRHKMASVSDTRQPQPAQSDAADQNFDYMFKLLLIGNSSVGKTSFLFRYADDSFTSAFVSTVGIDFKVKTVLRDGKRVKLQIWDTAGQERYRTITTAYYRGAMGFILMYDITNLESFNAVQDWATQIKTYSWDSAQVILVGNKCDLEEERLVPAEDSKRLADELGFYFFEASAKDNINVKQVFEHLVDAICDKMNETVDGNRNQSGKGAALKDTPPKNQSGCAC
ncbi:hypothetical protein GJAV_G00225230 [Gymnothorax javanicus]|nr:hypothetical protein GJAV_G00225230 [Gymnothorax javanicus]